MSESRITELLEKYLSEEGLSTEEWEELNSWIESSEPARRFFGKIQNREDLADSLLALSRMNREKMDARMHAFLAAEKNDREKEEDKVVPLGRRSYKSYLVAASLASLLGLGAWLWNNYKQKPLQGAEIRLAARPNDALPGSDKAVLTLADGTAILLDSSTTDALPDQGNTKLAKTGPGQLAYTPSSEDKTLSEKPSSVLFNTITTPRGGQFRLTLPDGTKVWLNNASSLRYPTVFTNGERRVALTGEAYFEVSHLISAPAAAVPFFVDILPAPGSPAASSVEVLGTHFDVNAYTDENATKTTLLQGSVRVIKGADQVIIKPGEQAQVSDSPIKIARKVDTEKAVAWKNGYFNFDGADLKSVMRQLARWYDVEVVYEGKITDHHFDGRIQRNLLLSQLLENIQTEKIHFKIEGRKVTVMP
ncbi:MAG: DUF4974 domain-containing protein [Puia sp.]|nr:DUF4974 domain-containing protein [Puia sp.]